MYHPPIALEDSVSKSETWSIDGSDSVFIAGRGGLAGWHGASANRDQMAENSRGEIHRADGAGRDIATPSRELDRLREESAAHEKEIPCRIKQAALEASGEIGFRNLTVEDVLDRSGGSRTRFYKLFANKGACYAAAYGIAIDRLAEELIGAAAGEENWRGGLRTALTRLARFVQEQPELARGILAEVHVAGEPALAKRTEVMERFSKAIDGARRDSQSHISPPPITAAFMLGAIEEAVVGALARGAPEDFAAAIPSLTYLLVATYFGDTAAREELRDT
jgi:AcrR family transcriptional regulator